MKGSRAAATAVLILTATLGLAGCSAAVNDAGGGASGAQLMPAPVPVPAVPYSSESSADAALPGDVRIGAEADRSIIVTGQATILAAQPETAAERAGEIVDRAGGRIDARSVQAPTDYSGGSATLTLRVPADALDGVIEELRGLGEVQTISTNASDVTVEVQDLEARIGALRASIDRLIELQAQASEVDALIQLETAISDRQAQLESLEAQQRYYDDQIAMSTLTAAFVSEPVLAGPEPGSFWDGILAGWDALGGFFAGVLVALGVLVPWLIPIVVIGAVVWIVIAIVRARRRRAVAPPPAPASPAPPPAAS